jgi:surface-anchored protein
MKKIVPLLAIAGVGSSQAVLFTAGELDFGVILEGSDFELEAHDVDNDIEYEVSEITVLAGADREFTVTSDLPGAGVVTGESLWILPQENVPGVPFVALASEELLDIGGGASDWSTNITFTLGSVTSPSGSGTFSVWTTDGLGANTFIFSSTNPGATDNGNAFESTFGHDHVNWGFTEPGDWSVELTASGTHNTFGPLSATETLTFSVIPEPSTGMMALLSVVGLSLVRRRK